MVFFKHLHFVEHFSLNPRLSGILDPMGEFWDCDIGLMHVTMPKLCTLELTNITLCEEPREFCLRHSSTSESISLYQCHANGDRGQEWARLSTAIADAVPPRLKDFNVDQDDKRTSFISNQFKGDGDY